MAKADHLAMILRHSFVGSLALLLLMQAWAVDPPEAPRFYHHLHHHDYEAAAEAVLSEGFIAGGAPAHPLELPMDWGADPYRNVNWRYQLNALYPLSPFLQGLVEGEAGPDWRRFVRSVVLDWIRYNVEEQHPNPFAWNDMATGVRASYLAQLIHLERQAGDIPPGDMRRLISAGSRHLKELADPDAFSDHNHGVFQMLGIAALCEVQHFGDCPQALAYAKDRYRSLFRRQFNSEGMHLEHSPAYHLLGLNVFSKVEASRLIRLSAEDLDLLQRARENLHWMIHPDGGFAQFGDTDSQDVAGAGAHHPSARWLQSRGRAGHPPASGVKVFPQTGYGFARIGRGGSSYLMLSVAHHSRVHKHADTFSFEWSDGGGRGIVDCGKWGYDSGNERDYVVSQRAHNVVELEGRGFRTGKPYVDLPQISVQQRDEIAVFRAAGRHGPGGFFDPVQERWLVLNPGEWLIVADDVASFWHGDATQWFQLPPEAELQQTAKGFEIVFPWSDRVLRVFSLNAETEQVAHNGERGDRWLGWYSDRYRELQPSRQFGFRSRGFRHQLATVFRWTGPDSQWPAAGEYGGDEVFCWTEPAGAEGARVGWVNGHVQYDSCEQ